MAHTNFETTQILKLPDEYVIVVILTMLKNVKIQS